MRVLSGMFTGIAKDNFVPCAFSLDFASSPLAWIIYHMTHTFKWIGASILVLITLILMFFNRRAIIKYQKETPSQTNDNN
mgnify:CR=1 FL=1